MSDLRFFLPISKIDKPKRMVWGYASTPTLDLDDEIVEIDALKAALPSYMEWRNIREMHQPSAVGVASEANIDANGLYIGAKIVDDEAWKKVETQVYKGFSIGGRTLAKDGNRITSLELIEISLVDRPANPDCRIEVVKAAKPIETLTLRADEAGALRKFFGRLFGGRLSKADSAGGGTAYADPGFQPDGKKRYPIDTAAHIRAAWAFIHLPRNRAAYNAAELTRIETNIIAAWKQMIDAAGPPAAQNRKQSDPIKGASKMAHDFAKRASAGYKEALGQALHHLGKAASLHEAGMACMDKGDFDEAHSHFAAIAGHHQAIANLLAKAAAAGDDDDTDPDDEWSDWGGARDLQQDMLTEGDVPAYGAGEAYPGKAARRPTRKFGRFDRTLIERLIKSESSRAAAEAKVEVLSQLPVGNPRARLFAVDKGALAGAGNGQGDAVGTLMQGVDLNPNNPAAATEAATQMLANMFGNPGMFGKSVTDPNFRGSASRSRN